MGKFSVRISRPSYILEVKGIGLRIGDLVSDKSKKCVKGKVTRMSKQFVIGGLVRVIILFKRRSKQPIPVAALYSSPGPLKILSALVK